MSNEPDAKRTRLSASSSQSENTDRDEEMRIEFKTFYDTIMSNVSEIQKFMPKVDQTLKKLVTKLGTDEYGRIKDKLMAVESGIMSAQSGLDEIKQIIDDVLVDKLHADGCTGSKKCRLKMQRILKRDPLSLERQQKESGHFTSHTPLHSAVMRGHVKCVKFLLEKGAKVTSLTMAGDSILQSLCRPLTRSKKSVKTLKLLLQYGVSCMFHHNRSGHILLNAANELNSAQHVSLLFQYGIAMDPQVTEMAISEAWEEFDLPELKLILLHCTNEVTLNPNLSKWSIDICYKKMILVGVPLDLCHEKLLEGLYLYKAFGGKFGAGEDSNQGLVRYLRAHRHRGHFSGAKSRIKALVFNPLSLQEICRLAIRKSIHKDYVENIKKLGLPDDLMPFLRFADVTITERPDYLKKNRHYANASSSGSSEDVDDSDLEL